MVLLPVDHRSLGPSIKPIFRVGPTETSFFAFVSPQQPLIVLASLSCFDYTMAGVLHLENVLLKRKVPKF